jgi:Domain of unknown function (DUF1877)
MGIDKKWQAVPDPCQLIEISRAAHLRSNRFVGEQLLHLGTVFKRPQLAVNCGEPGRCVTELLANDPTLATRTCSSERRNWDQLHYVISETRRGSTHYGIEVTGKDHFLDLAIWGKETLFQYFDSGAVSLGVRYLIPEDVQFIAIALHELSHAQLKMAYRPTAMVAANVYKYATLYAENYWLFICDSLDLLRAFYDAAAMRNEGAMIFTT